jgi:hypothetical protein
MKAETAAAAARQRREAAEEAKAKAAAEVGCPDKTDHLSPDKPIHLVTYASND